MKYSRKRAVALLSGGLDSIVSLAAAVKECDVRLVLFFDYDQRCLARERAAATAAAGYYGLPYREVDIRWLGSIASGEMCAGSERTGREKPSLNELEDVWIPNRNGIIINAAAAFAESYECSVIVTGFNRQEAEIFPDNRSEYIARLNRCLGLSTLKETKVVSYTRDMNKKEIIEKGVELSAPLPLVWSCYMDGERMCGICGSCAMLKDALLSIGKDKRPLIEFAG